MSKTHRQKEYSWVDLTKSFYSLIGSNRSRHITVSLALFCLYFFFLFPTFITGRIIDELGKSSISYPTVFQLAATMALVMVCISFGRLALKRWLGDMRSRIVYELNPASSML
jgi:hypothetical protein